MCPVTLIVLKVSSSALPGQNDMIMPFHSIALGFPIMDPQIMLFQNRNEFKSLVTYITLDWSRFVFV